MALKDRTTKRSFKPQARVLVLVKEPQFFVDPIIGGYTHTEPEWLDISEFLDVSVTNSMSKINAANVTLSNNSDRYFGKAREVSRTTKRQRELIAYLERVLSISEVRERNVERRNLFYELEKQGKVKRKKKYYRELDNGQLVDSGFIPSTRSQEYANFEFLSLDLDLMKRIWIDFKDRNDEWVAGFTGFISSISPTYSPGQISTLTLSCKGTAGILQKSEIVYAEAIEPKGLPFRKDDFSSVGFNEMTNNLANLDGDKIVETVIGLARDIYCFNTPNAGPRGKRPEDYYYQEKLWHLKGDIYPYGSGTILKNNVGYGDKYIAFNPRRDWNKTSSVASMMGKLIIDPAIVEGGNNNYKVFQQAIQTAFQLFKNKSMYAWNICQQAAEIVGYDFFEDAKGNLVFQVPKYDKLPRFDSDNEEIIGPRGVVLTSPEFDIDGNQETQAYTENYSDVPFHGRDYIIDDIGLKTRRYTSSEDGIVTYVTAHAVLQWMNITDEVMNVECFSGSTSYSGMEKLNPEIANQLIKMNRRFGVRRHETQPLITGEISNKELLNRWALQQLVKINAGTLIGTVDMNQRPDIWIGKTVYLVEEQKLGYVIGTTNSFNRSSQQPHTTSLSLAYVHHPSQLIGIPWQLATDKEINFELPGEQENPLI